MYVSNSGEEKKRGRKWKCIGMSSAHKLHTKDYNERKVQGCRERETCRFFSSSMITTLLSACGLFFLRLYIWLPIVKLVVCCIVCFSFSLVPTRRNVDARGEEGGGKRRGNAGNLVSWLRSYIIYSHIGLLPHCVKGKHSLAARKVFFALYTLIL